MEKFEVKINKIIDLLNTTSSILDYKTLLNFVLDVSLSTFNAEVGYLVVINEGGIESEVVFGISGEELKKIVSKDNNINLIDKCLSQSGPFKIDTEELKQNYNKDIKQNIINIIASPLIYKNKNNGAILLANKSSEDEFNNDDLKLLLFYSSQISSTIENVRNYRNVMKLKNYNDSLLYSLPAGLVITDKYGKIKFFNKTFMDIFLYNYNDLNNNDINLLFKYDKARYDKFLSFLRHKKLLLRYETKMYKKDNIGIIAEISCTVIPNVELRDLEFIILVSDITRKKLLQREIAKLRHLSTLGTFSAEIAHELKNPLAAIKGYIDIVPQRINDTKFVSKTIEVITEEVEKLFNIIRLLLTFAKANPENIKPISVLKPLNKVITLIEEQAKNSNVEIANKTKETPNISGDEQQLQQVFLNFIQNAIQAMPQGGQLIIESNLQKIAFKNRFPKDYISISIKDTGIGMSKSVLDKLFTPFFTTKESGTGLGLSICFKIIEDHKGKIEVKSEEGKGTEFLVYFPVVKE